MEENKKNIEGIVLEIQRMSTEDGPGLRTTVFLKGCSLKCSWCHNPESISTKPFLQWIKNNCIGCMSCIETCEKKALSKDDEGIHIDRDLCVSCGRCAEECPSLAIEMTGEKWDAEKLACELSKDRAYFENSGGGVTISGGELTMQCDFSEEVLKKLKELKINTAIDTCGQCSEAALKKLIPHADVVLFDLKEMNPKLHKRYTGRSNKKILENLIFVSEWIRENNESKELWIRTPVIPGATMSDINIAKAGKFISDNLDGAVKRWELCTFNNLCKDKYKRLGIEWEFENTSLIKKNDIERLAELAGNSVLTPEIVHWSGSILEE